MQESSKAMNMKNIYPESILKGNMASETVRLKLNSLRRSLLAAVLFLLSSAAYAQRFNISTNLLEYVNLGTLNVDASYSVAKNWSVGIGARYNPFSFESRNRGVFYNRQQSYSFGARYWLWHVNSGWWFGSKIRYQEYSSGGWRSSGAEEGDRYGLGLYGGYSYMILPHLNLEFGLGLWSGGVRYRTYSCPVCGITESSGDKIFILPDDLTIALAYVF